MGQLRDRLMRRWTTARWTRRLGAGAAIALMVLSIQPGLGNVTHAKGATVNLVMWQQWGGGHEKKTLDKYIGLFNKSHPGIHVSEVAVTDNTKIVSAISGGKPPDLMDLGTTGTLGQWAHDGLLQPLDTYIHSSHINMGAFVPAGWHAVQYNGHYYGVPFMNFNVGLVYNKKLFRAAHITHPPRTLQELDTDAARLTVIKHGRIVRLGFVPDYPASNLEVFAWLFGGDWFKNNGRTSTAALSANIRALQWEQSFYQKYGRSSVKRFVAGFGQYLTAADGFESGKVAMMLDGEWNIAFVKENVKRFQIGAAPFPAPAGMTSRNGTSYIDTNPQVIPTGSPHAAQAFEFIKWETTNPALAAEYATLVVNLPQLKHVPQTSLFKDPNFRVFENEANGPNAHQLPQTAISSQFATNLGNAEEAAILGKSSARSALQNLQKMTQQEIASTH
ncbi:MAG TPA: ABC transporter substrate-binding protein [Chloroflexota bacterium]|nr:ABC transporter substrate-binding protein [Chloroflexota bacterium]